MYDRIKRRRLMCFGHVQQIKGNRLPDRSLHCYIEGTRNRGRKPETWIGNIQDDCWKTTWTGGQQ